MAMMINEDFVLSVKEGLITVCIDYLLSIADDKNNITIEDVREMLDKVIQMDAMK